MHELVSIKKAMDEIMFFMVENRLEPYPVGACTQAITWFKQTGELEHVNKFLAAVENGLAIKYYSDRTKDKNNFLKNRILRAHILENGKNKITKDDIKLLNIFIESVDFLMSLESNSTHTANYVTQILSKIHKIDSPTSEKDNKDLALIGNEFFLGDSDAIFKFIELTKAMLKVADVQDDQDYIELRNNRLVLINGEKEHQWYTLEKVKSLVNDLDVHLMLESV